MSQTDKALAAAIKEVANAQVAEALGGDVLGKMVKAIIDHRDSSYRSDNKTMLEKFVDEGVRRMVEDAVRDYLTEHRESIKASVSTALAARADAMAATVTEALLNDDWRADLSVKIEPKQ